MAAETSSAGVLLRKKQPALCLAHALRSGVVYGGLVRTMSRFLGFGPLLVLREMEAKIEPKGQRS